MAKKPLVIRLDKSKHFSEVRGDRLPNDPHYNVSYMQDGLPFDSAGALVPDDGKTQPWEVTLRSGKETETIVHHPLYTDEMRERVKRKLERLAKGLSAIEEKSKAEQEEEDDVNFDMWLRGEIEYPDKELFAAAHKRFSVRYTKRSQLVEDLIYDHKVIGEDEVEPGLLALVPKAA